MIKGTMKTFVTTTCTTLEVVSSCKNKITLLIVVVVGYFFSAVPHFLQ
jgi:hypothetical protein